MGHVVLIPWGRLAASLFQPCLHAPHSHPPCPPCPPHPPGFVQERWIQGLLAFHCFLLLVVILFRRLPYVHGAVFFGCSERLALGQHGQCPLQGSLHCAARIRRAPSKFGDISLVLLGPLGVFSPGHCFCCSPPIPTLANLAPLVLCTARSAAGVLCGAAEQAGGAALALVCAAELL